MKPSRYIYLVPFDFNHHVIFSGMTKGFLIVPNDKLDSYEAILNAPDDYLDTHTAVIRDFEGIGLVIDDSIDEHKLLRDARNGYINQKEYKSIILPTFECNYNCWYCKQNHQPLKIDPEKIALIVKHLKTYLIENKMESYVLAWFGGEPLTQPDIIESVSKEMYGFCMEHGIRFRGGITTNGALLSKEIIKKLSECHIDVFQITIDGNAEMHDKTKYDSINPSAYRLLMENLNNLMHYYPDARLNLRFNYTPATIKDDAVVKDLCKAIPQKFRSRVNVDLQKVWQVDEKTIDMENLKRIQKSFVDAGFSLNTESIFSFCYVEKKHYNAIYYTAEVEKCDQIDMKHLRGVIDETGHIRWREKPLFEDHDLLADGCVCSDCVYFPICLNGCPSKRDSMIKENGEVTCIHNGDYSYLEHHIQDYCWRVIHNQALEKQKTV